MKEELKKKLKELIWEIGGEQGEFLTIDDHTDLIKDLKMDSLGLFQLADNIEKEWGVELFQAEEFVSLFRSFEKLVEYIMCKMSESESL